MIKRTMQEIADFFGCYVVKPGKESIVVRLSKEKPMFMTDENGYSHWERKYDYGYLTNDTVSDIAEHEWLVLVEPHKEAK